MQMAAPFILLGMAYFIGLGIAGRLVPQLQIMFVTQPLQIIGGITALMLVLGASMRWFLEVFIQQFSALTGT
jgi:flagellar biosynthetic protein FliR